MSVRHFVKVKVGERAGKEDVRQEENDGRTAGKLGTINGCCRNVL